MEANPVIPLFLVLGLIIAASRIGGTLARWLKQPRVLGELLVGVLLGPTLLDMLHWNILHGIDLEIILRDLSELGVIILMFIIGLEVKISELAQVGKVGLAAGVLGALVPIAMAYPLLVASGYGWQAALFTGVTLAATSVSISAQVLLELGFLQSKEGNALLATALIDDVIAILLVSLSIAAVNAGTQESVGSAVMLEVLVRMIVYLGLAFVIAWYGLPFVLNRLANIPAAVQSYGIPAFAMIALLLFAWSAEELGGVATITGSFIAGVGLSRVRDRVRHEIENSMNAIAYAFLVPIFFVHVGLAADLRNFPLQALPFALLLLLVAMVSKILGCGFGGWIGGFNRDESLRLGVCMISRGEVGLIVASLGVSVGVFQPSEPLFSALFLVILLTTLVTPILVRQVFAGRSSHSDIPLKQKGSQA
jgi:Kef-type K+ transport system membrane component KefB